MNAIIRQPWLLAGRRNAPPSFDQSFMTGSLGAGAVFTRASTAWSYNAAGTLVSNANNVARFDYDPVTSQLNGVLLEDASTNLALQSGNVATPPWQSYNNVAAAPVVTANQATAPDGTATAARLVFPAVSGATTTSIRYQPYTATAVPYTLSIWLRGNVGGEQIYLMSQGGAYSSAPRITLTTQWQRYTFVTATLTAATWNLVLGCDTRDVSQTSINGGTIYAWGGQVEALPYATSYIPTTGATVTRAADVLKYPVASVIGFDTTKGTLALDYMIEGAKVAFSAPAQFVGSGTGTDYISVDEFTTVGSTGTAPVTSSTNVVAGGTTQATTYLMPGVGIQVPPGVVHRGVAAWQIGTAMGAAHDGIANATVSGLTPALPTIVNLTVAGPMHFQSPVSLWARRVRYWPRQLSQTELRAATL